MRLMRLTWWVVGAGKARGEAEAEGGGGRLRCRPQASRVACFRLIASSALMSSGAGKGM